MFRFSGTAFPRGGALWVQGRVLATARKPVGMGAVFARSNTSRAMFQYMPAMHMHTKAPKEDEKPAAAAVPADHEARPGNLGLSGKMSYYEQFLDMKKKYGWAFVYTYAGVYVVTLSGFYFVLSNDLLSVSSLGFDPMETALAFLQKIDYHLGLGLDADYFPGFFRESPNATSFALSWVLAKTVEPFRAGVAFYLTPKVAKMLGRLV
jgi:hypothetical protein